MKRDPDILNIQEKQKDMKIRLLMLSLMISLSTYSQTGKVIFKIEDINLVPMVSRDLKRARGIVKSGNEKFNLTLEKYNIHQFRQLYPSSKREELLKYYILEADGYQGLMAELKEKFQGVVSHISQYFDPKPLYVPNDYSFNVRSGNDALRDVGLTYLDLINVRDAWNITRGDPQVVIGFMDSYLYTSHEDLAGKIAKIYDDNIRIPLSIDVDHGTMVAGIVGSDTNNDKGISSVAFNCRMAKTSTNKDDLLLMAQDGIKVINISQDWRYSNEADSLLLEELTVDYQVIVIAAAGNKNSTAYIYPASYESVFSVTSVGHEFDLGSTLNGIQFNWKDCHRKYLNIPDNAYYTHTHNDRVDICAPGYNILTTCHPDSYKNGWGASTGQLYSIEDGTSFAAPIVAGVCALMYSINPGLTPLQVKNIIQRTAFDIYSIPENAEYIGLLGAGRIDAYKAVKEAGTTYLTGSQDTKTWSAGYGFILKDVTINNDSYVSLKARKAVEINGVFEVPLGSSFEITIDPSAVTTGQ